MDAPASIRVKQQEAREQAYGPLNPQAYPQPNLTGQFTHNPMSYPTLGKSAQQMAEVRSFQGTEWTDLTAEQQWELYTDEQKQSMIAANYEHLKSANVSMIDDDDDDV